ncbi:hypothetical protein E6O75_ATG02421 [Venturia nashicola]|uniref:Uncharacterized protein n=1 Tax=Venturia nashicola TaxID=86259 RepID=A0A4Z1PFF1_9PEZI|nr:hypothetical protein E6O75_ATG02421 [Venturia nashicola]
MKLPAHTYSMRLLHKAGFLALLRASTRVQVSPRQLGSLQQVNHPRFKKALLVKNDVAVRRLNVELLGTKGERLLQSLFGEGHGRSQFFSHSVQLFIHMTMTPMVVTGAGNLALCGVVKPAGNLPFVLHTERLGDGILSLPLSVSVARREPRHQLERQFVTLKSTRRPEEAF